MPTFKYKVLDKEGALLQGVLKASDSRSARLILQNKEYQILELEEEQSNQLFDRQKELEGLEKKKEELQARLLKKVGKTSVGLGASYEKSSRIIDSEAILEPVRFKEFRHFLSKLRISSYDILICTRQLQQMLHAGLSIMTAMITLEQNQSNHALKKLLNDINTELQKGKNLTAAFSSFPETFSPTFIAMVRVGEETGNLEESFRNISIFLEREFQMRKRISAALTYPFFIFVIAIILILAIVYYFVPVFAVVFEHMRMNLPLPTQILIFIVKFTGRFEVIFLFVNITIILGIILVSFYRTIVGKWMCDQLKLSIPFIGDTILLFALAQMCNSMAIMLRAGVPFLRTLKILVVTTDLAPLRATLEEFLDLVLEGYSLTDIPLNPRFFPFLFRSFLSVGAETATLPLMMDSLVKIYEDTITSRINTMVNLLEPALMLFVSIVIGFVMISIFIPLYGAITSIGA